MENINWFGLITEQPVFTDPEIRQNGQLELPFVEKGARNRFMQNSNTLPSEIRSVVEAVLEVLK